MNFKVFFILGIALLPFDEFPFEVYGLGSNKPLSLYLFLLFLLMNIQNLIRWKFLKYELITGLFFIFFISYSFLISIIRYGHINNITNVINEVIGGLIIYFAVKIYFNFCNENRLIKILRLLILSYISSVVLGILQYIYIYIYRFNWIISMLDLLLSPRYLGYLEWDRRIQFSFGEPSFIGFHLILIIFPIILLFINKGIKIRNIDKIIVSILFFLGIIGGSLKFLFDILVFVFFYIFYYDNGGKKSNRNKIILIAIILLGMVYFINSDSSDKVLSRFQNGLTEDSSGKVRLDYSLTSFKAIEEKPFLGYGLGNFYYVIKENLQEVDPTFYRNEELAKAFNNKDVYLHPLNMYGRILSETGLFGLIWFIYIIMAIFKTIKHDKYSKFILFLLLYSLIQFDSFSFIQMNFWIALITSNVFREFVKSNKKLENGLLHEKKIN